MPKKELGDLLWAICEQTTKPPCGQTRKYWDSVAGVLMRNGVVSVADVEYAVFGITMSMEDSGDWPLISSLGNQIVDRVRTLGRGDDGTIK